MAKSQKSVSRAYGGNLTPDQVQERIIRAFLVEEQREVKKFLKEKGGKVKAKKASKKADSGAKGAKGGKKAAKK